MANDDEIIESLIKGGIIGAALGALLSKNNKEAPFLGAIAGAAILATIKANEDARKTSIPLLLEEDGDLYEVQANGVKKFIRKIDKPTEQLPQQFKLKY